MKVSVLRQAAVNSGSWKTRVKFAVPTHSGSEPGVYFWNAMITDRTAGYHENRMKQSSPPIRNPYAVAWSAIFLRSGCRGPRPAGRASPGEASHRRAAHSQGRCGVGGGFHCCQPRARIPSILDWASLSRASMSASFFVRTAETAPSRTA